MNSVKILMDDHEKIGIELDELDFIMSNKELNYPNLVHTFWKLCGLWDDHEKMEEEIFVVMKTEGFEIPIGVILTDHEMLGKRKKGIENAIGSGSDFEVRKALSPGDDSGEPAGEMREFVDVIRAHIEVEENVLSGVIVGSFSEEGKEKIKGIVGKFRS